MVSHFSANQYEDAFNSKKLRNWTIPRKHKEHPSTLEGFTHIVANDRGHLVDGAPRSKESPWGTFMGTWDMPCKIPPARPSYTARSREAARNLYDLKKSSPLNNAVNGYKKFEKTKKSQTSPIERPQAPTPPKSNEKILEPSAGIGTKSPSVKKSPECVKAQSPVAEETRKSPCGDGFKSPKPQSPAGSVASKKEKPSTPAREASPRSVHSRAESQLSQRLPEENRSVHSACTV